MNGKSNAIAFVLFVVALFYSAHTNSQALEYLPPLIKHGSFIDSSASFLFAAEFEKEGTKFGKYINALEIIDDVQPWPPRWYVSNDGGLSESGQKREGDDGSFSRYTGEKIESGKLYFDEMYIQKMNDLIISELRIIRLDKKMLAIDTLVYSSDTIIQGEGSDNKPFYLMYNYGENAKGQILMHKHFINYPLDLQAVTQEIKDSAVISDFDDLQIFDKGKRLLLDWKPTEKLNPDLFQFKENIETNYHGQFRGYVNDWTHMHCAFWIDTSNIMFCLKHLAFGKISMPVGNIVWQFNYRDLPVISGKDTLQWDATQDLRVLSENDTSTELSLYSLGNGEHPNMGVVFQFDKRTFRPSLIKYIQTKASIPGAGQGSFEYKENKYYLFSYGIPLYQDTIEDNFHDAMEYSLFHKATTTYQLPNYFYPHVVRKVENWPKPPRPVITQEGNKLKVNGTLSSYAWYKVEGPNNINIKHVGNGNSINCRSGTKYCVEGKYGVGYAVSTIYTAK